VSNRFCVLRKNSAIYAQRVVIKRSWRLNKRYHKEKRGGKEGEENERVQTEGEVFNEQKQKQNLAA